jgi:phosphatidylglycerophosphate synthase
VSRFTDSGRVVAGHVFTPVASVLLRLKVSPDAVTVIGTVGTSVTALFFYPRGEFFVGTLVICLFVFSDSLDGTMARLAGRPSTWGAFLDSTLDRVADAAIFCGIALWFAGDGDDPTMTVVTLAALVGGLLVSYARARAEGLGADASAGMAERTERLVLTLVAAGLSGLFDVPWLLDVTLWVVAVLSWLTVVQRIWAVRRQLLVSTK